MLFNLYTISKALQNVQLSTFFMLGQRNADLFEGLHGVNEAD